ncbi:hypothetical protein GCM10008986_09810 [Salinibacillus aidingensis]|uniref:Nucleoside 2-deoxyribosyltransferase n=1 Tax=Salinibacillus aidingensis TaxID=237684 RepID=A0ABP3KVJ3_9BACI
MGTSVFLSYPKPHQIVQEKFVEEIKQYLKSSGLEPRTLGVTDYDMDAPLTAIRRLMLESNGIITIAYRRYYINNGSFKYSPDLEGQDSKDISNVWMTSPYSHIEPAMAFQLGLPILILREKGVTGTYLPEFDLNEDTQDYLEGAEFLQIMEKWKGYVRQVVQSKGTPPRLYY